MSEAESGPRNAPPKLAKRLAVRRLLIATIGAASVNYATGCEDVYGQSVANLMAPPFMPPGPSERDASAPPPEVSNPDGLTPFPDGGSEEGRRQRRRSR